MLDQLWVLLGLSSHNNPPHDNYEPIASPTRQRSSSHRPPHSRQNSTASHHPPEDTRIKWAYFTLGAATLLSWNAMITATPYFLTRLEGSNLKSTFPSYLSSVFNAAGFASLAYATTTAKKVHPGSRVSPSILVIIICLLTLCLSPFITSSPTPFFSFVLLNATFQASAGAMLQSALVALASLFGPYAIQGFFAGQAAIGVLVSLTQYITTSIALGAKRGTSTGDDAEDMRKRATTSAFLFFSVSTAFLVFAFLLYRWLTRLRVYKEVVDPVTFVVEESEEEEDSPEPGEHGHLLAVQVESQLKSDVSILNVARVNMSYNFAVAYVFIITLAVFPPITSSIQSTHPTAPDSISLFSPILFNAFHFLIFNIGDYIGRAMCSYPSLLILSRHHLIIYTLSRTAFIPLFLACNLQRPTPSLSAPFINSDLLYLLLLLLFGITNGHLGTSCMIAATSNERLKREQVQVAATIAQFSLVGGLVVGSFMSFAVRAAVCDCNPFTE